MSHVWFCLAKLLETPLRDKGVVSQSSQPLLSTGRWMRAYRVWVDFSASSRLWMPASLHAGWLHRTLRSFPIPDYKDLFKRQHSLSSFFFFFSSWWWLTYIQPLWHNTVLSGARSLLLAQIVLSLQLSFSNKFVLSSSRKKIIHCKDKEKLNIFTDL